MEERNAALMGQGAVLVQHAVGAVESKKMLTAFKKLLKKMNVVSEPIRSLFERRDQDGSEGR